MTIDQPLPIEQPLITKALKHIRCYDVNKCKNGKTHYYYIKAFKCEATYPHSPCVASHVHLQCNNCIFCVTMSKSSFKKATGVDV